MKDKRVMVFRTALEELVESLDATLRLAAWDGADAVPEPLRDSASLLVTRLGVAERLAAGVFKGNPPDVARVTALTRSMRRLETAYLAYRKSLSAPTEDREKSASELHAMLDEVTAERLGAS